MLLLRVDKPTQRIYIKANEKKRVCAKNKKHQPNYFIWILSAAWQRGCYENTIPFTASYLSLSGIHIVIENTTRARSLVYALRRHARVTKFCVNVDVVATTSVTSRRFASPRRERRPRNARVKRVTRSSLQWLCRDDIVRRFAQRDHEQRRSLTFRLRARTSSPRIASVWAREREDFCAFRRCRCRRHRCSDTAWAKNKEEGSSQDAGEGETCI